MHGHLNVKKNLGSNWYSSKGHPKKKSKASPPEPTSSLSDSSYPTIHFKSISQNFKFLSFCSPSVPTVPTPTEFSNISAASTFLGTSPTWLLSRFKPERLSFSSCSNYLLTPLPQNSVVSHRSGCRLRMSQSKLNSPPACLPSHFTPSLILPNFIHASPNLNPTAARVIYPEHSQHGTSSCLVQ